MRKILIFSLMTVAFSTLLLRSPARADDPVRATPPLTFEGSFQSGVEAYQKQDYATAQSAFEAALALRPDEAAVLTNLGLTHFRKGEKGWALGYFRRALHVQPGQPAAQAGLDFTLKDGLRDIPHQIETWESLRTHVLNVLSLTTWAWFSLVVVFLSGWFWLQYFGNRKRAMAAETAMPGLPIGAIGLSILVLALGTLSIAKWWEQREGRATIVIEKVAALTSPSDQSPSLFELFEGLEVLIRQNKGDWLQVTYPGAMTGWIPKSSLMITQPGAE